MNSVGRLQLAPQSLLEDLTSLELRPFLAVHGDATLLLLRIPAGDTDLELGLDIGAGGQAGARPLPFRTTHQATPAEPRPSRPSKGPPASIEARRQERTRIATWLEKHASIAIPLDKRSEGDVVFRDRISVGRAQNKDIVLRHASVSKFHAWFEVDEEQTVRLFDSGSTNRTQVNGRPIEPKIGVPVASGDLVQFGGVEAVLCAPETLWRCVNRRDQEDATSA
ncbi:MAG: FHA domain-containing protein [Polyangiaceae bacterium]